MYDGGGGWAATRKHVLKYVCSIGFINWVTWFLVWGNEHQFRCLVNLQEPLSNEFRLQPPPPNQYHSKKPSDVTAHSWVCYIWLIRNSYCFDFCVYWKLRVGGEGSVLCGGGGRWFCSLLQISMPYCVCGLSVINIFFVRTPRRSVRPVCSFETTCVGVRYLLELHTSSGGRTTPTLFSGLGFV
jgi:hypothetical protein